MDSWLSNDSYKRAVEFSKKAEGSGEPKTPVIEYKSLNPNKDVQRRVAEFNQAFPSQITKSHVENYKQNKRSPSYTQRVHTDGDKAEIPKTQTVAGLSAIREGQERVYQERPRIIRTTADKGIETDPPQIPLPRFNVELREEEPRSFWECCKRRREQHNQVRGFSRDFGEM